MKEMIFVACMSLIVGAGLFQAGSLYGEKQANEANRRVVEATFKPVLDCFVEFHVSKNSEDKGYKWAISDFLLHQDYEKNGDRRCDYEVGDKLRTFLLDNGVSINEYVPEEDL